ncbi:MAG: glycosyltransferase family 2 protein [Ruminococcaceae bacterium]|nr:glycosyltransferase family 2 protein [Oscillospiraceae bacterium]
MDIAVSVVCNAYNQETYIRDALEGFVMQKTNFKFEVLVHDDASTDKTADIIREYEAKYPDLIKPIYQTENQYSKGTGEVSKLQYERAKGKYIAICEGDDYWTDPMKLQKQYDALEAHPEVDICTHKAETVKADTKEHIEYLEPADKDTVIPVGQVIKGGGGYVATNSIMYRSDINLNMPEFRKIRKYDYSLQIHGSLRGGMLYLNECMSVYRVMAKNSWTVSVSENNEKFVKYIDLLIKSLEMLNKETDYKYDKIISDLIIKHELRKLRRLKEYKQMKQKKYRHLLSFKERTYINVCIWFPFIIKIRDKLKHY